MVGENGIKDIEDKVREVSAKQEKKLTRDGFTISFVGEV